MNANSKCTICLLILYLEAYVKVAGFAPFLDICKVENCSFYLVYNSISYDFARLAQFFGRENNTQTV